MARKDQVNQSATGRIRGTVKWFSDQKGFGFITPEDQSKDCFVHYTGIRGTGRRNIYEGDEVEFSVVMGQKGPAAEDVVVTKAADE